MSARTGKRPGAIDLIEESVQILRRLPPWAFSIYYVGSLPFVLGFLYFWTDMSHGAFAYSYCLPDALLVSVLFVWMKICQAEFVLRVRTHVCLEEPPGWSTGRALRLLSVQTAIQPTGLIILPLAALITFPFGWIYAFYQNISFFGDGQERGLGIPLRKATRNAALLPAQNHLVILILAGFGFFVTLDIALALYMAPHLLKMLLGIETTETMLGFKALNTTFLALVFGIAYLVLDPLVKTVYALRCFYGESLRNGEDLRVGLKSLRTSGKKSAAVMVLFIFVSVVGMAKASVAESPNAVKGVDKLRLENSIEKVLKKREFSWRMPRPQPDKTEHPSFLLSFLKDGFDTISTWLKSFMKWVGDVIEWLIRHLSLWEGARKVKKPEADWQWWIKTLGYSVLCLAAFVLAAMFFKLLRTPRKKGLRKPVVQALSVIPDMEGESIKADDLPEDEWVKIAHGLMAAGNYRPALRALYLAGLSHLAEKRIIIIELSKSNRDYEREVRMRAAPSAVGLREAFEQNSRIFEKIWYGLHEVTKETVDDFTSNHERIMSVATGS